MKNSRRKNGFSLIELLMVMMIIGVMISIGITYFRKNKSGAKRHTVSQTIVTMIRRAKEIANLKQAIYKVNFNTANMYVKIVDAYSNQFGKIFYLPETVRFPSGKLPPNNIECQPSGVFKPVSPNKIYIEEKSNPGIYDRIDIFDSVGQVKLIKDTNS